MYIREDVVDWAIKIVLVFVIFTAFGGLDWLVNRI